MAGLLIEGGKGIVVQAKTDLETPEIQKLCPGCLLKNASCGTMQNSGRAPTRNIENLGKQRFIQMSSCHPTPVDL